MLIFKIQLRYDTRCGWGKILKKKIKKIESFFSYPKKIGAVHKAILHGDSLGDLATVADSSGFAIQNNFYSH